MKEKPLSPKLQKRKKRAEAAEALFSFIVVILSLLLPYIVVSTNDWSEVQYTLFFKLLVMLCFSICAVRLCHFYIKTLRLRRKKGDTSSLRTIFFKKKYRSIGCYILIYFLYFYGKIEKNEVEQNKNSLGWKDLPQKWLAEQRFI